MTGSFSAVDNTDNSNNKDTNKNEENNNPRQRKVSHIPTVSPQIEEYSGDEEVTRL